MTTTIGNLMTTVIGRNGYTYDAYHLLGDKYIVGKHIVRVEDGRVQETLCRATKANVARIGGAS